MADPVPSCELDWQGPQLTQLSDSAARHPQHARSERQHIQYIMACQPPHGRGQKQNKTHKKRLSAWGSTTGEQVSAA